MIRFAKSQKLGLTPSNPALAGRFFYAPLIMNLFPQNAQWRSLKTFYECIKVRQSNNQRGGIYNGTI